jgi:Zn-dependent peptidase ImmA (M78 family)
MAKQYRRPLLTFYLADVPRRGDRGEDFRTLPEPLAATEAGLVDAVVRDIRARQALVRASLEAAEEAGPLPFVGSKRREDGVAAVVNSIVDTLGFERDVFRSKAQLQDSFAYLRELAEAAGVFVLLVDNLGSWHTTIGVEAFRGFALADDVTPFVAVNANDSPGAWSFTLVHELAHLWLGATGVSGDRAERAVEKFCNDVAGEVLLPARELDDLAVTDATPIDETATAVTSFARARRVSSTMVAYKLYRRGALGIERFRSLKTHYRQLFLEWKAANRRSAADQAGGPNYYVVRKHRVGTTLIRFVERMLHEGTLSTTKAGKVLGVASHNVHALLKQGRPNHAA